MVKYLLPLPALILTACLLLILMHFKFEVTDKCVMTEDAQQHQSEGDAS
jgi:hypothetical protein